MFDALKKPILSTALVSALAPAALAQGFGVGFTHLFGHGAVSIGFSTAPLGTPFYAAPCPPPRWVPGHYETVCRPVFVEGCLERAWVPARFGWMRDRYGRTFWGCIEPGHFVETRRPGRYENRDVRVWVEGAWR